MTSSKLGPSESISKGRYRHYKGGEYEVIGVAHHTETEEPLVVYRYLYGDFGLSVRPLHMFVGHVLVDGQKRPRFKYLGPPIEGGEIIPDNEGPGS